MGWFPDKASLVQVHVLLSGYVEYLKQQYCNYLAGP